MEAGPEERQKGASWKYPGRQGARVQGWLGRAGQDGFQVLFVNLSWNLSFHVCQARRRKRDEVYKAHSQEPGIEQTRNEPSPDRGIHFRV